MTTKSNPSCSSDYLLKTSREYALYVCEHRGIPKVTDGLKQVQRMALWMLRNKPDKVKTVALTGMLAAERIYVHGDAPCNEAISQLAAPYKNNVCLIEGHGAFGSRLYPDSWGQARYTEVQQSKIAKALLYRDLDIIPLEDNYDGSNKQPKHFLPLVPLVLLNGVSGIAVGWSTNILPRDLKTLIEATRQAVSSKPIKPLPPHFTRYDVQIGALGGNRWQFTGHIAAVGHHNAHVTELPPGLSIENFRKRLIDMEHAGQIKSFMDRSTDKIDIVIRLNPGSPETAEALAEFFKLHERTTERIVVLDWDEAAIRTYDQAEQIVQDFVAWRLGWYLKRFEHLTQCDRHELNYWMAIQRLLERQFPKKLGSFANKTELENKVIELTGPLDGRQLDRIVSLPTYRWTKELATETEQQIAALQTALAEYTATITSPDKLREVYLRELDDLKGLKL